MRELIIKRIEKYQRPDMVKVNVQGSRKDWKWFVGFRLFFYYLLILIRKIGKKEDNKHAI